MIYLRIPLMSKTMLERLWFWLQKIGQPVHLVSATQQSATMTDAVFELSKTVDLSSMKLLIRWFLKKSMPGVQIHRKSYKKVMKFLNPHYLRMPNKLRDKVLIQRRQRIIANILR